MHDSYSPASIAQAVLDKHSRLAEAGTHMEAEAARLERLGKLGALPAPFGAIDEVLLHQAAVLRDAVDKSSPPPMDKFLSSLTASLLGPCTAQGVPGSVPMLVRRSLESLGWNVAQNRPSEGAGLPSVEQATSVMATARQELVAIAAPRTVSTDSSTVSAAPLTPRKPCSDTGASARGSGDGSLRATAESFSFSLSAREFTPGRAAASSTATGYSSGGNGNPYVDSGRPAGQNRRGGGKGVKLCRFGSKCTRADCYFAHPERDGQPTDATTALTGADPVLSDLAAELAALDALQDEEDLPPDEDFEAFLAMSGQATDSSRYDEDDEFERAQEEWLASQGANE